MEKTEILHPSLQEVHQSVDTTQAGSIWKKIFAFFGPAYLVSVGYMDPGNWATDLAGGSQFGYTLIWVILMSNLMAVLLQVLSARLGIVRGRDLAQANREVYPASLNFILYVLAEIAIAATDLAEVLGMAIGLQLLFHIPLLIGVLITAGDTLLILVLQRWKIRKLELLIISLIAIIGVSLLIELLMARPQLNEVARGFIPHIPNQAALYIAIGIIGATVMPHNLYLHSALVQTRKIHRDPVHIKRALKLNFLDSFIALNLAFLVNVALLILSASVFHKSGYTQIAEIQDAYQLLEPLLGSKLAPILFGIALIASGQSSTITGTLAGQIVMEGYLRLRINPMLRRLITRMLAIIPAVLVITLAGEHAVGNLLILSQVILSMQLSFAIIPLIIFVSDRHTMGRFALSPTLKILSWLVVSVLVYLNVRMVFTEILDMAQQATHPLAQLAAIAGGVLFAVLLLTTLFYPFLRKRKLPTTYYLHTPQPAMLNNQQAKFQKIALALDFSEKDRAILSHALSLGNKDTEYLLIHVVESVSARILGRQSFDQESQQDQQQLATYIDLFEQNHRKAKGVLAFQRRGKEIVRIVQEEKADLLIMGGHGHRGIKDLIYGETVNYVRHHVHIPVLIV
ncbi:MAG: Nramp family divalent metal transporter [Thermoflavifilum sp.]|nr:Nramp family divalent metal transporter [Thermoflavifilum sp.]